MTTAMRIKRKSIKNNSRRNKSYAICKLAIKKQHKTTNQETEVNHEVEAEAEAEAEVYHCERMNELVKS